MREETPKYTFGDTQKQCTVLSALLGPNNTHRCGRTPRGSSMNRVLGPSGAEAHKGQKCTPEMVMMVGLIVPQVIHCGGSGDWSLRREWWRCFNDYVDPDPLFDKGPGHCRMVSKVRCPYCAPLVFAAMKLEAVAKRNGCEMKCETNTDSPMMTKSPIH